MSPRDTEEAQARLERERALAASYHLPRLTLLQRRALYAALEELSRALAPACDAATRGAAGHPTPCWWCQFAWDAVGFAGALGGTKWGRADQGGRR